MLWGHFSSHFYIVPLQPILHAKNIFHTLPKNHAVAMKSYLKILSILDFHELITKENAVIMIHSLK